jgi:hypothetical protein
LKSRYEMMAAGTLPNETVVLFMGANWKKVGLPAKIGRSYD